jgi:type IV pilus assembly protein PilB
MKSPDANNSSSSPEKVEDLFSVKSAESSAEYENSDLHLFNYGTKGDDSTTISLVNDIFLAAFTEQASDIHIEPREKLVKIRFRVDGNFVNYKDLPLTQRDSLIARIKIMAYLRIDEHRLPQDGKINYKLFAGKTVDMRISVIPTIYGEKCVIRILKKDEKPPELKEL